MDEWSWNYSPWKNEGLREEDTQNLQMDFQHGEGQSAISIRVDLG